MLCVEASICDVWEAINNRLLYVDNDNNENIEWGWMPDGRQNIACSGLIVSRGSKLTVNRFQKYCNIGYMEKHSPSFWKFKL